MRYRCAFKLNTYAKRDNIDFFLSTSGMSSDQLVGLAMLGVATAVFSYYTAWVFLVPFLDQDSVIQNFFLPREYAIKLPILLLLLAALAVGTFIGNVMVKNAQKEKAKKSKKAE